MMDISPMIESTEIKPTLKWMIVIVAIAAAAMSLWLTFQKLTDRIDTLAGCGAGSECANVLGSKWSMVLGVIPVSIFSFILYIAVLVSLWVSGVKVRWFRMLAAWMFIGAAVWFTALQLFVLHTICPYCMTMHGLGVLLGVLILLAEFKVEGALNRFINALTLAIIMVVGLAAVQHFGPVPETHRVDELTGVGNSGQGENNGMSGAHARGKGRVISFFDGRKFYRIDELPHLGPTDAEHVIVKYYDYTCSACRDVHGDLEKIMLKHPGKLAVIVLPVPLNKKCNPNLPFGVKDHENACEFAKLSLRVWRADRSKFPEFHQWLFEYHAQPYQAAEAMAYSLVGTEKMDAVDTAWVDAVLLENVTDYKAFVRNTPVMPKVLLKGSKIMQGVAKDTETLEKLLRLNLGF